MNCPHCDFKVSYQCQDLTNLGYKQYRCRQCKKQYNERTGTSFNFVTHRSEVVILTVFFYYRFKMSLDDVASVLALRGINVCHQTIHNWIHTFGVSIGKRLRKRRYKRCSDRWHVDATYIKIEGRWCYFYRAIDKQGNLVDVYLSDTRDLAAAEAFFTQAAKTSGVYPDIITTDKEAAFGSAVENIFGDYTDHRDNKFKNNLLEQDHRGIKSRTKPMKGLKNIFCAQIFCTVYEEIRSFFRMKNKSRAEKRRIFAPRFQAFNQLSMLAS